MATIVQTRARAQTAPRGARVIILLIVWIAITAFQFTAVAAFAQVAGATDRDQIRALVARGTLRQLRRADFAPFRPALEEIYRETDYAPRWLPAGTAAGAVLAEISDAASHGLDPADYDVDWIGGEIRAIQAGDRAPERIARADVALTVSFCRFLSDLSRGRVTPEQAGFKFGRDEKPLDLPALVRSGMTTGRWHDVVASAEPSFPLYRRLKEALARYRSFATVSPPPLPPLPSGKRKIVPGESYAGVAALSERLRLVGDLPPATPAPTDDKYQGALVDGVRAFQSRHGLKDDGVLGKDTLDQLGTPVSARLRQIELSLERLRWLPEAPPGPLIAVNIPSFRLWAFAYGRNDVTPQVTMPVIVGRAMKARETPVFIGEMHRVEFSPYWNVTPAIQRGEIVPKLERDGAAGYWNAEGLEAVSVDGKGEPITVLDAKTIEGLKSGALRVRQRPGPKNALGGVKFVLPNTMNIYLHSTPAQELFSQTRRDFSHGCIRVEDPPALAAFVLRDQPAWTPERIRDAMAAGKLNTVSLAQPIPVVLFYTTAIVDSVGRDLFSSDIYGLDTKLESALRTR
ncbi:MAG TPA: L,D-transpeptidase family protein [Casimicrobiaceae bacterium]|nr:L,D-transpeptidase family protein [Casimicrobiaceae bacterium]